TRLRSFAVESTTGKQQLLYLRLNVIPASYIVVRNTFGHLKQETVAKVYKMIKSPFNCDVIGLHFFFGCLNFRERRPLVEHSCIYRV
ncbi:hypothetical protein L9F63_019558, partial [Diploptera punctata]